MPTKTIEISPEDLSSLQRVLSSLSDSALSDSRFSDSGLNHFDGDPEASVNENFPRARLHKMALTLLTLRKRRSDFLYRAMFGEPAYDMLLGLYVAESDERPITAARLAHIAGVAQSSAARWIEYLVAKGLIQRERHPAHKRASILNLSPRGREALEGLFATMFEALCDVRP